MNMTKPWLKKAHLFSAILLIIFIVSHLINHLMILHSEEAHLQFMNVIRKIYRFPPIEILLYTALLFQSISGSALLWRKRKNLNNIWDKLQLFSGAYFIYFLVAHPAAVLYGRYVLNLDTNLYYGAVVLTIAPLYYFFTLHYGLAIVAFFVHTACAVRLKMQSFTGIKTSNVQSILIILFGVIIALKVLSELMKVAIPKEYLDVFK